VTAATQLDTLGAAAVYLVLIGFVFAECALLIGFFLPGDTLLFAGGLAAADPGRHLSPWWLLTGVVAAAVLGEVVGYLLGARMGESLFQARNPRSDDAGRGRWARWGTRVLTPANLARAEAFTRRYGVLALVTARWVPWVRTFAPLLAGATGMRWSSFLVGNVVGAACWAPVLVLAGYYAGEVPAVEHLGAVVAGTALTAASIWGVVQWRKSGRAPR